jgi:hypothetical protein
MKKPSILIVCAALIVFIAVSCLLSEYSWNSKENTTDNARAIIGLSSVAVGNLNPAARNPGLEFLCTGLYDDPGGYCYYFANGIPFEASPFENTTVSRTK